MILMRDNKGKDWLCWVCRNKRSKIYWGHLSRKLMLINLSKNHRRKDHNKMTGDQSRLKNQKSMIAANKPLNSSKNKR